MAAACSAETTMYDDGLVVTIPGKMLASTTKRLSVPYTLVLMSTTESPLLRPSLVPSLFVPFPRFSVSDSDVQTGVRWEGMRGVNLPIQWFARRFE